MHCCIVSEQVQAGQLHSFLYLSTLPPSAFGFRIHILYCASPACAPDCICAWLWLLFALLSNIENCLRLEQYFSIEWNSSSLLVWHKWFNLSKSLRSYMFRVISSKANWAREPDLSQQIFMACKVEMRILSTGVNGCSLTSYHINNDLEDQMICFSSCKALFLHSTGGRYLCFFGDIESYNFARVIIHIWLIVLDYHKNCYYKDLVLFLFQWGWMVLGFKFFFFLNFNFF